MRRLPFFVFMITCSFPGLSYASDIATESEIRAATVYTNRAKIERQAVIDLPAGSHTIIFKDLPAGIYPDSLQVEGTARADVTFGALSYKQDFKADLASAREKELNDKLDMLLRQKKVFDAEKSGLAAQKTFLQTLGTQARLREDEEIATLELKPEQWLAAAEAIRSGISSVAKSDLDFDHKIQDINKEIQKVRRDIDQLRTGQKVTWEVAIPVESAAATKLTANLSYQMRGATWQPFYDARLDTENDDLKLVQYGVVRQNTGEDWNNIALTLSTAQPHRGAGLPDLAPLWVDLWQPNTRRKLAAMKEMQFAGMDAVSGAMPMSEPVASPREMADDEMVLNKAVTIQTAKIETGGFVSEYKIPGPSTVKADGTESKLLVGGFETDNHIRIEIKPQYSVEAYLVARATLKGDAPILPGQVNLFRDGAYVGQSFMPLLRPGEEQSLSFGIDDQVSIKRHTLKDERSAEGVITKDSVITKHFVTEIQNLHSMPVDIAVLETVPVAKDEKIEVEIKKNETTPGYKKDVDNVKGLFLWDVPLAAKEKKEVKLGWEISWPKDASLNGL